MNRDRVRELEDRLRCESAGESSMGESRLAAVRAHVEATEAGDERVFASRTPRLVAGGVLAAVVIGASVWALAPGGGGGVAPEPEARALARGAPGLMSRERWAPAASAPTELALTAEARRVSEDVRRLGEAFRSRLAALEQVSPRLGAGGLGG